MVRTMTALRVLTVAGKGMETDRISGVYAGESESEPDSYQSEIAVERESPVAGQAMDGLHGSICQTHTGHRLVRSASHLGM